MSESIRVDNLAKEYAIGPPAQRSMLRERLAGWVRHPTRSIQRRRETIWALRDVSFQAHEGEVVGIIGRNGAGKSTLLKILSKITYPTLGRVKTHGRLACLLEVGTGFHDELTGRENINLNGSILGMKKAEVDRKLDTIVSYSGVEKFIDTPIKHYSSGMRLRLGFAVAAHLDPDVLIIDEVLAVGDAGFQKKCLNTMEGLRNGGRTVIFVSHNMGAVESLCPRAIWIEQGQVRMDGDSRDVVHAYMTTFADPKQGMADLRHVTDRQGTGEIQCTAVEFLSAERVPQPITRTGDSVVVRFRYHARTAVSRPSIGFRLYTELGVLITSTSTWSHRVEIPLIDRGEGYADLDIACLNLVPGRYTVSVWIADGSQGSHVYDSLEHCARLEIAASNAYGSVQPLDSRYGILYLPQRWDLTGIPRPTSTKRG